MQNLSSVTRGEYDMFYDDDMDIWCVDVDEKTGAAYLYRLADPGDLLTNEELPDE